MTYDSQLFQPALLMHAEVRLPSTQNQALLFGLVVLSRASKIGSGVNSARDGACARQPRGPTGGRGGLGGGAGGGGVGAGGGGDGGGDGHGGGGGGGGGGRVGDGGTTGDGGKGGGGKGSAQRTKLPRLHTPSRYAQRRMWPLSCATNACSHSCWLRSNCEHDACWRRRSMVACAQLAPSSSTAPVPPPLVPVRWLDGVMRGGAVWLGGCNTACNARGGGAGNAADGNGGGSTDTAVLGGWDSKSEPDPPTTMALAGSRGCMPSPVAADAAAAVCIENTPATISPAPVATDSTQQSKGSLRNVLRCRKQTLSPDVSASPSAGGTAAYATPLPQGAERELVSRVRTVLANAVARITSSLFSIQSSHRPPWEEMNLLSSATVMRATSAPSREPRISSHRRDARSTSGARARSFNRARLSEGTHDGQRQKEKNKILSSHPAASPACASSA